MKTSILSIRPVTSSFYTAVLFVVFQIRSHRTTKFVSPQEMFHMLHLIRDNRKYTSIHLALHTSCYFTFSINVPNLNLCMTYDDPISRTARPITDTVVSRNVHQNPCVKPYLYCRKMVVNKKLYPPYEIME